MLERLPLFLSFENRTVLVVGAGTVALQKVSELKNTGAKIFVVAPRVCEGIAALAALGAVHVHQRAFVENDLENVWLVIAATNDTTVNREIAIAAEARRIFVNAVDDPDNASAYFASLIRRPPFVIAISSAGELPGVSRLLREILEQVLPDENYIAAARALRRKWRAQNVPMKSRFAELLQLFRER